eukprot:COSAG01_NODE_9018_length_2581_cov_4.675262_1_plen_692_part_01
MQWPAALQGLVGYPPVAECLGRLGVHSLADFGEIIDADEGHDALLRAAVEALPDKPKKKRQAKARARTALEDLLASLAIFEELDVRDQGHLTRAEAGSAAAGKVTARADAGGGTLSEHFERVCDGAGLVHFHAFVENFALAESEGVPPASAAAPSQLPGSEPELGAAAAPPAPDEPAQGHGEGGPGRNVGGHPEPEQDEPMPHPEPEVKPEPGFEPEPEPEPQSAAPAKGVPPAGRSDGSSDNGTLGRTVSVHPEPEQEGDDSHPFRSCLDREYVQKEIRWAWKYKKKIIVLFEKDQRRAGFFDHGEAWGKYRGTAWEAILNIDAEPYQRDEGYAQVMVQKILQKTEGLPAVAVAVPALNAPGSWDLFLSHAQATGGDQVQTTSLRLKGAGQEVWYDNAMLDRSTAAMEEGVKHCRCFVLFLTGDASTTSSAPAAAPIAQLAAQDLPAVVPAPTVDIRVFIAHRGTEVGQQRAEALRQQLGVPSAVCGPVDVVPADAVVVVLLLSADEAPFAQIHTKDDPARMALGQVFAGGKQVVVPVVDQDFAVSELEGLPDDVRQLARQLLVPVDWAGSPEAGLATAKSCVDHVRLRSSSGLAPTLTKYLRTIVQDCASFKDPCTQKIMDTERQCVPLRLLTLSEWESGLKSTYENRDAADLLLYRRRLGYGGTIGYGDRRQPGLAQCSEQVLEADVHF